MSVNNPRKKTKLPAILGTVFFALLSGIITFPFIAMIIASFRPGQELIRYGLSVRLDPEGFTLQNWDYLFNGSHAYFTWYMNSVYITVITVVVTLLVCYFVAYGLTMYHFKFRNLILLLVIATMMVPFEILMLPLYKMMIDLSLINTLGGVILPGLVQASTVFFFAQYLQGIPHDLLDAGRIDGANEYLISVRIVMPVARPAFAAMAILVGMGAWNNMLWPMLVFRDADKFTLSIGLNTLLTPYGNNYDLLIAGSCFAVLPILILFLLFQQYFVEGMSAGSVKG